LFFNGESLNYVHTLDDLYKLFSKSTLSHFFLKFINMKVLNYFWFLANTKHFHTRDDNDSVRFFLAEGLWGLPTHVHSSNVNKKETWSKYYPGIYTKFVHWTVLQNAFGESQCFILFCITFQRGFLLCTYVHVCTYMCIHTVFFTLYIQAIAGLDPGINIIYEKFLCAIVDTFFRVRLCRCLTKIAILSTICTHIPIYLWWLFLYADCIQCGYKTEKVNLKLFCQIQSNITYHLI
jgi:hypothetical protein